MSSPDHAAHTVLFLSDSSGDSIGEHLSGIKLHLNLYPHLQIHFLTPANPSEQDFKNAEFIMLDYAYYQKNQTILAQAFLYPDKLSLFAALADQQQMVEILKATKAQHLFGMSGTQTLSDMAEYLVSSIQHEFLTAKSFATAPLTQISRATFTSAENLEQQIEKAVDAHDFSASFDVFRSIVIQVLNELITNALYNAPVNASGDFLYQKCNRKDKIGVDVAKAPKLEIYEDAEKIILGVKDFYGTLTKKIIQYHITQDQVIEKEGGAGVGLFLILKHAHKVVVNIDPQKMTEFIIVLYKFKRFYHYQTLEKSFHLYIREKTS